MQKFLNIDGDLIAVDSITYVKLEPDTGFAKIFHGKGDSKITGAQFEDLKQKLDAASEVLELCAGEPHKFARVITQKS